jgi:hypothetical protein
MSRRVCETCAWFAAGEYEHGICVYRVHTNPSKAKHWVISPVIAAERIRMSDDTCEHWEREEDDANEAR